MIEPTGIANLYNNLQNQIAKNEAHATSSLNFMDSLKAFVPGKVAVLDEKAASELNFSKWRFEDLWNDDPDEKLIENPYDTITRIFRKCKFCVS